MRKILMLVMLLWAPPVWADSITISGAFVEQSKVIWNPQEGFSLLYPNGTLLDTGPATYVRTISGWMLLPLGHDWVTHATAFTGELFDDGKYNLFGPTTITEATVSLLNIDGVDISLGFALNHTATSLDVFFAGHQVGHADLETSQTQVPEPVSLVLMLVGLAWFCFFHELKSPAKRTES